MTFLERAFRFNRIVEERWPPLGDIVETDGKIHVLRAGPRGGAPLVLIHGASGNLRDWTLSIFDRLAAETDVIAIDRPGFGYSSALPDYGWMLKDQIRRMRKTLHAMGVTRIRLAGHSYGGSLAMRWALDHPDEVSGLALIAAPVMDWGGGGIGLHYQLGGRPIVGDFLARIAPLVATPAYLAKSIESVFAPQDVTPGYLDDGGVALAVRPRTYRVNATMMLCLYPQMRQQALRNGQLACPVEIIHGTADTIVPSFVHAEPLAALLEKATLTLMDGVGHMPHHVDPELISERILALPTA